MASAQRAFFGHVESGYFYPGTSRNWWMTGFGYGDVVSVTAQSVGGLYGDEHGVLMVDNVRVDRPPERPGRTDASLPNQQRRSHADTRLRRRRCLDF